MNCLSMMEIFVLDFINVLFFMKSVFMSCNTGIFKGKLKGVMMEIGSYGYRNSCDVWLRWFLEMENFCVRKCMLLFVKFFKNFCVIMILVRV